MKKKTLIVEDDQDLRQVLQLQLEHRGYETILARSGKQAVDFAAAQLPDHILMDIRMPADCLSLNECVKRIRMFLYAFTAEHSSSVSRSARPDSMGNSTRTAHGLDNCFSGSSEGSTGELHNHVAKQRLPLPDRTVKFQSDLFEVALGYGEARFNLKLGGQV